MTSFTVEISAAPAYELLLSIGVFCDSQGRQSYELDDAWFEAARRAASPELLAQIDALAGTDMVWDHLLSLAHECPPPRDVSGFLAYLEQADAAELRLRFLGYYVRHFRRLAGAEVIAAAATGDRAAQREFRQVAHPDHDGWQRTLEGVLPLDAGETKSRIVGVVRSWYEQVFRQQEASIMAIIARDAERLQALLRARSPERLLETALPGFEYVPEPGIRHVLLIPSWVVRPQIDALDHGETTIFACGVDEESLQAGTDAPSPRLLRLAKALGDERRLRVLKRLTGGDATLHELAVAFEVSDTTMLHHLVILRAAGLIRVRGGTGKRYSLQREVLPEMGALLDRYLQPDEPGTESGR